MFGVDKRRYLCLDCHHVGPTDRVLRGNGFITFLLIWFLIIPAIAYSAWRSMKSKRGCRSCGSTHTIPADTPKARQLIQTIGVAR